MNTANNASIRKKLKQYRLDHCWTLRQMSMKAGISVGTIQKIEAGKVKPHDLTIAKLQRAFPDLTLEDTQ